MLNDDIVSLTALMLIMNPECRDKGRYVRITQVTLSLYLITQCQLKLHHSVTSLDQTLDYLTVAQRRHPADRTLDKLTLKLIERKVVTYVNTLICTKAEYRKDDRAMHPICGCRESFRESLSTPTATFAKIFNGLLFRLIL